MPTRPRRSRRSPEPTSERILEAATAEFNEHGFGGTDTNRIARRAGFAPQTFYRWFEDKLDVFIKIYDRWRRDELATLSRLLGENASDARLAQAVIAHHKAYVIFRRSLRQLSVENAAVRAARAESRLSQIAFIRKMNANPGRDDSSLAVALFQTERLADAVAEGEFRDMGLDKRAGERALTRLIHDLRRAGEGEG
jgi:AcrR family transcriptional regulator